MLLYVYSIYNRYIIDINIELHVRVDRARKKGNERIFSCIECVYVCVFVSECLVVTVGWAASLFYASVWSKQLF